MSDNKPPRGSYAYNKIYAERYAAKFVRVTLRLTPGLHDRLDAAAQTAGESVNTYITRAIEARIDKDNMEV